METDYVDAEGVTDIEVSRPSSLAIAPELDPERLKLEIARQKEMRGLMLEYVQSAMVKGHHYYYLTEKDENDPNKKPALSQEGAYTLCNLLKLIPGQVEIFEEKETDGHYSVRAKAPILNLDGIQVASGDGSCSTHESKYRGRWAWPNEVPAGLDKSTLKSKTFKGKGNKEHTQYFIDNPELADQYNTVLKMAAKRATVAAVRKLPFVSEVFAVDPDAVSPVADAAKSAPPPSKPKSAPKTKDVPAEEMDRLRDAVKERLADVTEGDTEAMDDILMGRTIEAMTFPNLEKFLEDLNAM